MTFRGEIKNGVVVLEEGAPLPDGTIVRVEPVGATSDVTVAQRWERVIGMVKGLPLDLAEHHDRHLHGQPKK